MSTVKNARPLYKLNAAEMNDPTLVIHELFDFADLADTRELLWSWLKITVTGTYHKELSSSERSAIITLYEKMEKLVEAAHVIYSNPQARKISRTRSPKLSGREVAKETKAQRK